MRRVVLRTSEEKADVSAAWSRPDDEFFATGACHVLAAAFIAAYPGSGFRPWRIVPFAGHRGSHVVVARGGTVFDWMGFQERQAFLFEYFEAMRGLEPGWDADFVPLESDPVGWEFCRQYNHRHPSEFLHDPTSRATAYVAKFFDQMLGLMG
jgi:hypothetical protein